MVVGPSGLWIAALAVAATESTVVHRCVGNDGTPRYQDAPCAAGDAGQRMELKVPAAAPANADNAALPVAPAAPASPPDEPWQEPPPGLMSWRCEVENGEVFFRHDRCPESLTEPVAYSTRHGDFGGLVYLGVWAYPVPRTEACREIDHRTRFGAERDQVASPYEKLSGRDLCR